MEQNHMLVRPGPPPLQDLEADAKAVSEQRQQTVAGPLAPALRPTTLQKSPHLEPHFVFGHSLSRSSPPSYAQSHEPAALSFPDAPTTELPPIQPHGDAASSTNNTLPSLSSVTGAATQAYSPSPPRAVNHWPSLNPLTAYYIPSHALSADSPQRMDLDITNGAGAGSAASPERYYDGRAGSVSLDDPDVRMAAEALGDLRADFVSSPPDRSTPLPTSPPSSRASQQGSEPLLSLLTTSHPLLATTIEGATSAYNNSKNFSPRFKVGAEYVEGYLTPIGNTLGSVGRVTGVEGGVRWFLGGGRRQHSSSDLEAGERGSNKRRKVDVSREEAADGSTDRAPSADLDLFGFTSKDRRTSMSTVDTLPAYDEYRSPAYSESPEQDGQVAPRPSSRTSAAWQHRLIMSTSGLSVAMSEESLRSLKYCLHLLRWANGHIGKVITTLKTTLDQYEKPSDDAERGQEDGEDHAMVLAQEGSPEARSELAARINALRGDVLKTLRDVIDTVSKYAGGALPENARELVKRHLKSLPQRFRLASMQEASAPHQDQDGQEKEVRESAQKALVLAKEGLDMMAQVSGVLDGTIVSAEEWCERLGRKRQDGQEATTAEPPALQPLAGVGVDADVKMDC